MEKLSNPLNTSSPKITCSTSSDISHVYMIEIIPYILFYMWFLHWYHIVSISRVIQQPSNNSNSYYIHNFQLYQFMQNYLRDLSLVIIKLFSLIGVIHK